MKRSFGLIAAFMALLLFTATAVFAESGDGKYTEQDKNGGWYYRSTLSEGGKAYYDAVVEAATNPSEDKEVVYWDSECGYDDVMVSDYYYYYEHPELYWLRFNGTVNTNSRVVERDGRSVTEKYVTVSQSSFSAHQTISMEQGIQEMAEIEREANAFMADIDLDQPEAAVALDIHDKLIAEISYDYTAANRTDIEALWDTAHTLYGAMVEKSAVCDGYAMAYTYLLRKAGIESIVVDGTMNTAYAKNVTHAWNMVKLGGEWYETDATHDDSSSASLQHTSYNVTTETMNTLYDSGTDWAHSKENFELKDILPVAEATHFSYEYMKDKGVTLDDNTSSTEEKLALAIDQGGELHPLSEAHDGTEWTLRLCKQGSALKPKKNNIYSIEKVTTGADLVTINEVGKDEGGYFARAERNASTAGSSEVTVKVVFDNGSISYVRGVLGLDNVTVLKLNRTSLELTAGESFALEVITDMSDPVDAAWSSSDETIASVDSAGKVTALSEGDAVITCEAEGVSLTCRVKVNNALYSGTISGSDITWTIDQNGLLKVSGTGALPDDFMYDNAPWHLYRSSIKNAIVGEGITAISGKTLYQCTNLKTVVLPSTLTKIDTYAFYSLSNLESIRFTGSTAPAMSLSGIQYCRNAVITAPGDSTGYLDYITAWEESGHSNNYKSFKLVLDETCVTVSDIPDQNYTCSLIVPEVEVTYQGNTLAKDTDYQVTATNDDSDGTLRITFTGSYTGTVIKDFNIVKQDISELRDNIVLTPSSFTYTGSPCIPLVTITGVESEDYEVSVTDNLNAGIGHVTVTGKGRFTGSVTLAFTIEAKEITPEMISLSWSEICKGSDETMPDITVMDGDRLLTEGTDYTAVCESGAAVGSYPVTVTGINNYKQDATVYYSIKDHSWDEGTVTKTPTCTEDGIMKYVCTRDQSHTKTESIAKLAHTIKQVAAKEATCSAAGNIAHYECEVCHNLFADEDATQPIAADDVIIPINADAHDWDEGVVTTQPTCTAEGIKTYTCNHNSEHKKTEAVSKLAHTTKAVAAKDATCSEAGNIAHYECEVCHSLFADEAATQPVDAKDVVIPINSDAHDWDEGTVTTQPTCTTEGVKTYTCRYNSEHKKTETIAKLAHTIRAVTGKIPTCSETGLLAHYECEVCHEKYQDEAGLIKLSDDDVIIPINAEAHDWDEGVVTTQPTCTSEGVRTYICKHNSEHKKTEAIGKLAHTIKSVAAKEATCSEAGNIAHYECEVCHNLFADAEATQPIAENDVVIPINADAHDWDEGVVTTQPTCTTEGVKTFTCKHNSEHTKKESIAKLAHTIKSVAAKDATCSAAGNIAHYECEVCHSLFADEEATQPMTENDVVIPINADAHDWDEGVVTTQPTCTSEGVRTYTCKNNNKHKKTEVVSKLAHTIKSVAPKEATCSEAGNIAHYECEVCHNLFADAEATQPIAENDVVIPINTDAHDWDEGVVTTAPTCTAEGVRTYTCKNNNKHKKTETINKIAHTIRAVAAKEATCSAAGNIAHYECEVCHNLFADEEATEPIAEGGVVIPINADAHDWNEGVITTQPTCTSEGVKTYTCKHNSEHKKTEAVSKLAHTIKAVAAKEATCSETGNIAHYECVVCHNLFSDEEATKPIAEDDVIIPINNDAHNWNEGVVTTQPTCTSEGVKTYTCKHNSEHKKTESIAKLAHTIRPVAGKIPTCSETGLLAHYECEVCHEKYQDEAGLIKISNDDVIIPINADAHDWDEGVVTTQPTCTAEGVRTFTCKHNSEHKKTESISKLAHTIKLVAAKEATCSAAGIIAHYECEVCHNLFADEEATEPITEADVIIPINDDAHDWDGGVVTTQPTCTVEGVRTYTCKHNSEHKKTETINKLAHKIKPVAAKEATCSEAGNIAHYECDVCHNLFADEEAAEPIAADDVVIPINSDAHDWDEGVVTTEPTCTAEGVTTYTCKHNSEHVRTEAIAKLGHQLVFVPAKEATNTEAGNIAHYECEVCHEMFKDEEGTESLDTADAVIPAKGHEDKPGDTDEEHNTNGKDGTPIGEGASFKKAEKYITSLRSDNDPKGSVFGRLQAKSVKQTKKSVTVTWKRVNGASKYVLFGNKCGIKNRMKKLKTLNKTKHTLKKILNTKVKKDTYYKFIVVAVDKSGHVVSTSKIIHVATKGGKVGNHKKITTRAKKNKVTLKKGKKFKLAGKGIPVSSKLKVRKHVAVRYESSKPSIASVTSKGVIKGIKKGKCVVYVYAQNGVMKQIKVTVK